MTVKWTDYGTTDVGRIRRINEDAFLALPTLGPAGLWVVADGMGGHEAGELASSSIVDSLLYLPPTPDFEALIESVVSTLERVNADLHQMAQERERSGVIGSTVVALLVHESGQAVCLWAGDSRLYRLRRDSLERLSKDHSHVQWLVDYGVIDEAQAENHPNANVVTKAVGADATVSIDRNYFEVRKGDVLLLCSDGVTKELHDAEIMTALQMTEPRRVVDHLVHTALEHGGRDNITVVCVHVRPVDPAAGEGDDDDDEDTTRRMPPLK